MPRDRTTIDNFRAATTIRRPRWVWVPTLWCVIPAAGRSTRIGGLTRGRPKALLEIGNKSVIEHLLDRLGEPFTDACIVAAPDGLELLRRLGDSHGDLGLHYAVQPEATGVADAVSRASDLFRGPFVVLMGDCFYDQTLSGFVERWKETEDQGAVLVEPAASAGAQPMGLVTVSDHRVSEIFKAPWAGETDWRVCGAYLFPESYFAAAADTPPAESGERELEDVVTRLIATGVTFRAIPYGGWRRNINTPEDLAAVEERVAEGLSSSSDA